MPSEEATRLIEAKMVEIQKELAKRVTPEERERFFVMLLAGQAVILDGAIGQLRDEIAVLRMVAPKDQVERAWAALEQAKKEETAR
jgi:hypothetical protein